MITPQKTLDLKKSNRSNAKNPTMHYFAYMRRSTKKDEQAESLLQQAEGIKNIAKLLDLKIEDITFFTESRSGFENRKRPEWDKMISEIDELWKKGDMCTILCRDTSRLSRNPRDNSDIADRLFGDNDFFKKRVIDKIYMLGSGAELIEWSHKSDKKNVWGELQNNYNSSLDTKHKSMVGIILKLDAGEFPYTPPHGLIRVNSQGLKRISKTEPTMLMKSDKFPYIRRVFEMKIERKTAKEISKYLKKYAGINIASKKIVETIIQNTVYKGEYTEKTTGKDYTNLKFFEGKPPIDKDLWQRANDCINQRGSGYGEGQAEHLFPGRIVSENGSTFQLGIQPGKSGKGKYYNYKGVSKDQKGRVITINISETNILEYLSKEIADISEGILKKIHHTEEVLTHLPTKESIKSYIRTIPELIGITEVELDQRVSELMDYFEDYTIRQLMDGGAFEESISTSDDILKFLEDKKSGVISPIDKNIAELRYSGSDIETIDDKRFGKTQEVKDLLKIKAQLRDRIIYESLESSPYFKRLEEELEFQKSAIDQLRKQRDQIKEEIEGVYDKAFAMGYDKAFADKQIASKTAQISMLDDSISNLENNEKLEDIVKKLPFIFSKIVELSSKALRKGKFKENRDYFKMILQILGVELLINNKKELKIKLFEGLEDLGNDENGNWSHLWDTNP